MYTYVHTPMQTCKEIQKLKLAYDVPVGKSPVYSS